jgi:hypothetical protein
MTRREIEFLTTSDGRPWVHESRLPVLAIEHVTVGRTMTKPRWKGDEPQEVWVLVCALCGHEGMPHDEEMIAGHGDGEGGNHAYWRAAWPFAQRHVLAEHRAEFPESRWEPPSLYYWWMVRFDAEREDMERRHQAEMDALRAFQQSALMAYRASHGERG